MTKSWLRIAGAGGVSAGELHPAVTDTGQAEERRSPVRGWAAMASSRVMNVNGRSG